MQKETEAERSGFLCKAPHVGPSKQTSSSWSEDLNTWKSPFQVHFQVPEDLLGIAFF